MFSGSPSNRNASAPITTDPPPCSGRAPDVVVTSKSAAIRSKRLEIRDESVGLFGAQREVEDLLLVMEHVAERSLAPVVEVRGRQPDRAERWCSKRHPRVHHAHRAAAEPAFAVTAGAAEFAAFE